MRKIYQEPRLETMKFNIEECIMDDGGFPEVDASNSEGWEEESTGEWI